MEVKDKIVYLRKINHMSQEDLAEKIGISRQSISRWENGTALPDANNLLALSQIFSISIDELLNEDQDTFTKMKDQTNYTILQLNTIKIAIIAQACMLNVIAQPWFATEGDLMMKSIIVLIPLLISSIWMARNHILEKNLKQRAKNTKIEMIYCCIQSVISIIGGHLLHVGFLITVLLLFNACYYIIVINPKYMNRALVSK